MASGQVGSAGQRLERDGPGLAVGVEPVARDQSVDPPPVVGPHLGDDEILVRCQPEMPAVDLCDPRESRAKPAFAAVGDPSGLDAKRQIPAAV
jgi:hypothetical protein